MTQNNKLWFYNLVSGMIPGRYRSWRTRLLRWCGVECADTVLLSGGARFYGEGRFVLGTGVIVRGDVRFESNMSSGGIVLSANSEVNHGSYLAANDGSWVRVGQYVRVAHFVSLKTSHHKIDEDGDCIAGDSMFDDICIGDGSWLCTGCIVLPGVRVGRRNVIAAGAVVTKDTEDGVLMAGVPATIKKSY